MHQRLRCKIIIVALVLPLVILAGCCKKATDSDMQTVIILEPVEAVATDITLTIYADGYGHLLETKELPTEEEVIISVEEEHPYHDPPQYYVYAEAAGFYTELYYCRKGDTISVDLDGVGEHANAVAGVTFMIQSFFADSCYAEKTIELTGPGGIAITITTDEQGRYGLGNLPLGTYTLRISCSDITHSYEIVNGSGMNYRDISFYAGGYVRAPNIYLYPETEMDVAVELGFPYGGHVLISEPPYDDGWRVHAQPVGLIDDEYDYLFYEAILPAPFQVDTGWILNSEDLEGEFRRLLDCLGFIGREIDDFVEYWVPRLTHSPWYAVYPQDADSLITLKITPTPRNIRRALFVIRPLDRSLTIPAPPDPGPFARNGFTVVEWGAIDLSPTGE